MEYKGIAADVIGSAKRWLASAELNASHSNYDLAIYSLEMSVEISMKAVLMHIGIDVPKTHAIGDIFTSSVKSDKRIPKDFKGHIEESVDVFNALLGLRAASGYIFETKTTMEELKAKYEHYKKGATTVVELCARAVQSA
ncbi:MAG: HEPN domain-containing protein [Cuniculiplasma sp.]